MNTPTFNEAPPTVEEVIAGFAGLPRVPGALPAIHMPALDTPAVPEPAKDRQTGAPAAPSAPAAPRWLTEKKRVESYALEFPFELGGVEYREIMIRRLTAGEVAAFMAKMRAEPDTDHRFPLYYIGEAPIPDAVWDALDDDDRFAVTEIGTGFLPARFRAAPAA